MTLKYANEEGVATALADVSEDGLSPSSIVSTDVDGALTNPYWIGIMETADPGFGVGNLSVTKSEDGAPVMFSLENQSNTADSSGRFDVRVAGASAGDPYVNMDISGVGGWSFGVDNSDDDTFKIDHGGPAYPGLNTYFSITTGGVVKIPNLTDGALVSVDSSKNVISTDGFSYDPTLRQATITGAFQTYLHIIGEMTGEAGVTLSRGDGTSYAQTHYYTSTTNQWVTGLRASDDNFHFFDVVNSVDAISIAPGAYPQVNIGTLQAGEASSRLSLFGANSSANGPHISAYTASDNYPLVQNFNYAHDNISILFDCYFDPGVVITSSYSGSNFSIAKGGDQLRVDYDSGQAPGTDLSGTMATALFVDTSGKLNLNQNLNFAIGKSLALPEGSNACKGSGATMVSGTVTVSTTAVNTGDIVLLMKTADGGVSGPGMPTVTIVDGTSFAITDIATNTSTYSWAIIK